MLKPGQNRRKSITHSQIKETKASAEALLKARQHADTLLVDRVLMIDLIRCTELLDELITAQDRRES